MSRDTHGRFLPNPDDRRLTKVYGLRLPARLEPVLLERAAASGVEPTVYLRVLVTEALDALTVASDGNPSGDGGRGESQSTAIASDGLPPSPTASHELPSLATDSAETPLTVPEFAQLTGKKPKTLNTQIQRRIFEKQNPGWIAQRTDRGHWLISPAPCDGVG
jgi:hypothetical protein